VVACFGFSLFRGGAGKGRGFLAVDLGKFKLKASSVGSVVMATSFLWATAAILVCPSIEKKNGQVQVYSFLTSEVQAKAQSITTAAIVSDTPTKINQERLKEIFEGALAKLETEPHKTPIEVNGQPAQYLSGSTRITKSDSGEYLLNAKAKSGSSWVDVTFKPSVEKGRLSFIPDKVNKASAPDEIPN
jgi:hypothetical protein